VTTGARQGRPTGLRRLLAAALPPQLEAFVLPGADVARTAGLDLAAAGLRLTATPRHASVLLIVGALPEGLRKAALVVFAQMPRPRVLIALDAGDLAPLPSADVVGAAEQQGLADSVAEARRVLREEGWSLEARPLEAEGLVPKRRKKKKDRPAEKPAPEDPNDNGQMDHGQMKQGAMEHGQMSPKQVGSGPADPGEMLHGDAKQGDTKQGGTQQDDTKQGDMKHGDMKHGGMGGSMDMGFMSMVRLTQHLPKSADGLPMERVQAPFGPFFPGLPSGLDLTLWLDGDTVARVDLDGGTTARGIGDTLAGDVADLPSRLSRIDPLTPNSYRRLALQALWSAVQQEPEREAELGWLGSVELERAASHLNWLASFGYLIGYTWLAHRAAHWQLELLRSKDFASVVRLEPVVDSFLERVSRTPLLSRKLRGVGQLGGELLEGVAGPVARASGLELDARLGDPLYGSLGFEPVLRREGDALARLTVRVEEIRGSLALVRAAGRVGTAVKRSEVLVPTFPLATHVNASPASRAAGEAVTTGEAKVETPRGEAMLELRVDGSQVANAKLVTPSSALLKLIERVAVGFELADALTAIGSLDVSPWEAAR